MSEATLPRPKACPIVASRTLYSDDSISIEVLTDTASQWVDTNAEGFGILSSYGVGDDGNHHYTLKVHERYKGSEIIDWLNSYRED